MNRELKRQIKLMYGTPDSKRKKEFLESLQFPKIKYADFVCTQIDYIRKRNWFLSSLLLLFVIFSLNIALFEDIYGLIWIISSALPFAALIAVIEISRSPACRMTELEMSCRYSLSDIVLIRLGIIWGFNAIVFAVILICFIGVTDFSLMRLGLYIFTPFMLTCTLSLAVINRMKTRETSYICGAVSCFVSVLNSVLVYSEQGLLGDKYLTFWFITFLALVISALYETVKMIKGLEELNWSLPLTD